MIKKIYNSILDFFYSFSDILFTIILIAGITYVLNYNIVKMVNLKNEDRVSSQNITGTQEEITKIKVNIPASVTKEQLADLLKAYSLIEDQTQFIKEFEQKKPNGNIKSGNFELKKDATISEILDLLVE